MGVKCILLYKLPKGVQPSKRDAERLITVLTEQLCCIQADSKTQGGGEKQLEAVVIVYKQAQAPDLSIVSNPSSLKDIWAFRLAKEAHSKVYLMLKGTSEARVTEADANIRTFLERRMDYRQRVQVLIHSYSWTMGDRHSDVTIKLLQVSQQGQTPKVLALEVTYHPAVDMTMAQALLHELADKIISLVGPAGPGQGQEGYLVMLDPKYSRFNPYELSPNGMFGPMHTVVAYNELLTEGLGAK